MADQSTIPSNTPPFNPKLPIAEVRKPTVGRIVNHIHVGPYKDICAAIITRVHPDGSIDICTFVPDSHVRQCNHIAMGPKEGQWSWPVIETNIPVPSIDPKLPIIDPKLPIGEVHKLAVGQSKPTTSNK